MVLGESAKAHMAKSNLEIQTPYQEREGHVQSSETSSQATPSDPKNPEVMSKEKGKEKEKLVNLEETQRKQEERAQLIKQQNELLLQILKNNRELVGMGETPTIMPPEIMGETVQPGKEPEPSKRVKSRMRNEAEVSQESKSGSSSIRVLSLKENKEEAGKSKRDDKDEKLEKRGEKRGKSDGRGERGSKAERRGERRQKIKDRAGTKQEYGKRKLHHVKGPHDSYYCEYEDSEVDSSSYEEYEKSTVSSKSRGKEKKTGKPKQEEENVDWRAEIARQIAMLKGENETQETESYLYPFARHIRNAEPDPYFRRPDLVKYSGDTRAINHISSFEVTMSLLTKDDATRCKALASTLTSHALEWYQSQPANSITDYHDFRKKFLENFSHAGACPVKKQDLCNVRQKVGESLMSYMGRFRKVSDQIPDTTQEALVILFSAGLEPGSFKREVGMRAPKSLGEMFERIRGYEGGGDYDSIPRRAARDRVEEVREDRRDYQRSFKRVDRVRDERRPKEGERFRDQVFTKLNIKPSELIKVVELPPAREMQKDSMGRRDKSRYCEYHKDIGHMTDECFNLKRVIQMMIDKGELRDYILRENGERGEVRRNQEGRALIDVINEVSTSITQLNNQIMSLSHTFHVPAYPSGEERVIGFTRMELATSMAHGLQPIVVTIFPPKKILQRVLVDTGASRNILYYEAFRRMEYTDGDLTPYGGLLEGFTNHTVKVKGTIIIDVEMQGECAEAERKESRAVEFLVIDLISPYNAIIGIPILQSFETSYLLNH